MVDVKKIIQSFVLVTSYFVLAMSVSVVSAFQVEIYTERTPEAPGYFSLTIQPPLGEPEMDIQNVYVKNFDESDAERFRTLLPLITEFGGTLIEKEEEPEYISKAYVRLIALGENYETQASLIFVPRGADTMLEDFDHFTASALRPVYLQNISLQYGGNIEEVYPEKIEFITDSPIRFVGRYKEAIKTRVEIVGTNDAGEMVATIPLDLNTSENINHIHQLPEEWEAFANNEIFVPESKEFSLVWLELFPWVIAGIGCIIIAWIFTRKEPQVEEKEKLGLYLKDMEKRTEEDSLPFER